MRRFAAISTIAGAIFLGSFRQPALAQALNYPPDPQKDAIAAELAADSQYQPKSGDDGKIITQCSKFVRDFAQAYFGSPDPDLAGNVASQAAHLAASQNWHPLAGQTLEQTFQGAAGFSEPGGMIVVLWVNPKPTATDSGHIAVVMPGALIPSGFYGMPVPAIAQAGKDVFARKALSFGFGSDKMNDLKFYGRGKLLPPQ
jgi:hypothetical protein